MTAAYSDLYQYDRLAEAYRSISQSGEPPDLEERAMNLANHLIWDSYCPGTDTTNDRIVKAALGLLFRSGQINDPRLAQLAESLEAEGRHSHGG